MQSTSEGQTATKELNTIASHSGAIFSWGSSLLVPLPSPQSSAWTILQEGNVFWKTSDERFIYFSKLEIHFVPWESWLPLFCHFQAAEWGQATAPFCEGTLLENATWRLMEWGSTLQPFTGRHCPASAEQADEPVPNLQWHGLISRARSALNTASLAEQGQPISAWQSLLLPACWNGAPAPASASARLTRSGSWKQNCSACRTSGTRAGQRGLSNTGCPFHCFVLNRCWWLQNRMPGIPEYILKQFTNLEVGLAVVKWNLMEFQVRHPVFTLQNIQKGSSEREKEEDGDDAKFQLNSPSRVPASITEKKFCTAWKWARCRRWRPYGSHSSRASRVRSRALSGHPRLQHRQLPQSHREHRDSSSTNSARRTRAREGRYSQTKGEHAERVTAG